MPAMTALLAGRLVGRLVSLLEKCSVKEQCPGGIDYPLRSGSQKSVEISVSLIAFWTPVHNSQFETSSTKQAWQADATKTTNSNPHLTMARWADRDATSICTCPLAGSSSSPSARSPIAEGAHGAPLAPHKLPRRAPSRRSVVAHAEAIGTLRRTGLKEGVFGACGLAPTVSMEGMSKIKRTVRRGHR
ncbi:predicted protein [Chaetomium globosum CBS 148.51]|uniref:Uncharacterized protein n=1 Tax=Chaetomium globosum (strain ATCC 6205 / CBS 148.51 / DSM 1962 / NBRC 6347 / NRRL 1970) TaxID=306901 RepID=Q2H126_CHAGB|nr:uncharacterized protein CHGG_04520 [Chaetomium globosum CBS 148.51]EAQ87901.1 predicted protein [Chaetomium globosum CBS 148.51]